MACRPLYQPQFPHTTWGSFADPQRGQRLRAGTSSVQAVARLLRLLALEVFFFGTAMTMFPALYERMPGCASGERLEAIGRGRVARQEWNRVAGTARLGEVTGEVTVGDQLERN